MGASFVNSLPALSPLLFQGHVSSRIETSSPMDDPIPPHLALRYLSYDKLIKALASSAPQLLETPHTHLLYQSG